MCSWFFCCCIFKVILEATLTNLRSKLVEIEKDKCVLLYVEPMLCVTSIVCHGCLTFNILVRSWMFEGPRYSKT